MTEAEYQSLKAGDKVEFGKLPCIEQCVINKVERDIVYLDQVGGGEQRYYPAYVQNSGRLVADWTKPKTSDDDAFANYGSDQSIVLADSKPLTADDFTKMMENT